MRKAEKRRLGEERAKQAAEETRLEGLKAQERDRLRRERIAAKRATEAERESKRLEAILAAARMSGELKDEIEDTSSVDDLECAG